MSENEKELTITRVFDAPRQLVFEAWTKPEHLKKWCAPHGFDIPSAEGKLEPGGSWRSSMTKPDGTLLKLGGVYQEIVPGEKLVFTHAWDPETGGSGHKTVVTVTFADHDGKTKMHFHQAFFLDKESRDGHNGGWSECFDRLAELLEQM
jgi:uncharacterized protein YndB with AHSA1/START domain